MSGRKIARRDFVADAATAPLALGALGALGCSGGDGDNGRDAGRGRVAAPGEQDRLAQILDQAVVVGPVPIASPIRGLQAERMRLAAERRAGIPARVASWDHELAHVRTQVRAANAAGVKRLHGAGRGR